MDSMPRVNFVLYSNNKNELRNLYNHLNGTVVASINTWNDSLLGYNQIMSHQVDSISSQRLFKLRLLKVTKSILQQIK